MRGWEAYSGRFFPTPDGVADISRWLSAAKPPVAFPTTQPTPGGVVETSPFHSRYRRSKAIPRLLPANIGVSGCGPSTTPSGVVWIVIAALPVVFAALNH